MQLGMVGLGKMGANMVRRLRQADLEVVAYDIDATQTEPLAQETGAVAVHSLEHLVRALSARMRELCS